MRKIIKLTESDLTRIVKRVVNEQREDIIKRSDPPAGSVYSSAVNVMKNATDKVLISCLKNKGYKVTDTGGKYRYMLEKEIVPNTMVTLILTISSQDDKNKASLTITNHQFKVLYSNAINITPELLKNCQFYQQVVVAYGEALKKAMK
jgi:hypothetical protein